MNKMTYPEKCVVHKGFFPDTIPSEEINYALYLWIAIYMNRFGGAEIFLSKVK